MELEISLVDLFLYFVFFPLCILEFHFSVHLKRYSVCITQNLIRYFDSCIIPDMAYVWILAYLQKNYVCSDMQICLGLFRLFS